MLSIEGLRSAFSEERLCAYALPDDADEVDGVARYLWNLALCSALHPALHTLEIAVRNRLFKISKRIVDETKLSFDRVPCWLDAQPSLLADRERRAVEKAKNTIRRHRRPMTEGRLVSALGFLDPIRDLRNRVSHHEAVWDRQLDRRHQEILEIIGWINRDLARTLEKHSPLPAVIDKGAVGFRGQAEAIIK